MTVREARVMRGLVHQADEVLAGRSKDLDTLETRLRQLRETLTTAEEAQKELHERIPESADIGGLLAQLDRLIKKRAVTLARVQPQTPEKQEPYTATPIRLVLSGEFSGIYYLLQDLEALKRVIVPERLVITRPDLNQPCRVDLKIRVFER